MRTPLIVGAVAAVALAGGIGGGIALTSHGKTRIVQSAGVVTPATTTTAAGGSGGSGPVIPSNFSDQTTTTVSSSASSTMAGLAQLLSQSAAVRSTVQPAIDQVSSCDGTSEPESTLQSAVSARQQILAQLQSVDASSIPDGSAMLQVLQSALQDSVSADQAYLGWMQDVDSTPGSCSDDPTQDSSYESGQSSSAQANTDKANFANLWNADAGEYGQQQVSPSGF